MTDRRKLLTAAVVVLVVGATISGCSSSSTGPSPASDTGEVYGYVRDALTAMSIEGATVTVDGEATVTDSLGYYRVEDVETGSVTVEATMENFVTVSTTVDVGKDESIRQDCVLIPSTLGQEYRIVLTWGANPRDLDSHLWVPLGEGQYSHVYYGTTGSTTMEPYAELDVDAVFGYGPETITVFPEHSGLYTYAVYHFAGEGTHATSEAVLRIYQGNLLRYTLTVPDGACGDNWWWNVCTFDAQAGVFTIVNTLQATAPIAGRQIGK